MGRELYLWEEKKRKTSVLKVDFSTDDFVSISESLHPSSKNSDTKVFFKGNVRIFIYKSIVIYNYQLKLQYRFEMS